MNPTATQTLRRDRPDNRPTDRQRPNPPDERVQALTADLIQALARVASRRF
jgi:hypothetical protein